MTTPKPHAIRTHRRPPAAPAAHRADRRRTRAARSAACACLLVAALGFLEPAAAQERVPNTPTGQILGGSFFPFARSFTRPPERCVRLADSLRDMRDDGTLQPPDFRRLRRVGCAGAGAF